MTEIVLPDGVFTRADLLDAARAQGEDRMVGGLLASLVSSGRVVRVGRGHYVAASGAPLSEWCPTLSQEACRVIDVFNDRFPLLDVRIWETSWLNEFLNHLIARNTILACVEAEGREFAFEELSQAVSGRVLLNPSADDLMHYGADGAVAVVRLVSEAPKGVGRCASIEQIIVDLLADRLVRSIVPHGDLPEACSTLFGQYPVDQVSMFRYARRRNKESDLRSLLVSAGVSLYA